jgi:hypothetical protein
MNCRGLGKAARSGSVIGMARCQPGTLVIPFPKRFQPLLRRRATPHLTNTGGRVRGVGEVP